MTDVNELKSKIDALSQAQLEQIAGGECTTAQIIELLKDAQNTYENLIDFTSYMIERVAGP